MEDKAMVGREVVQVETGEVVVVHLVQVELVQSAQGGNVIEALVSRHRNLCGLYSEYKFCYLNCPVFKFMNCKSCTSSTCCL